MEYKHQYLFIALLVLSPDGFAANEQKVDPAVVQLLDTAQDEIDQFLIDSRLDEILKKGEEAYVLSRSIYSDNHKTRADLAYFYGSLLQKVGIKTKAEEVLKEAITLHESAYGIEVKELIRVLAVYGAILPASHDKDEGPSESSLALHRALNLQKQHDPNDRIAYADLVTRLAPALHRNIPERKEALQMMQESLAVYEAEYGENAPQLIPILIALGDAYAIQYEIGKPKSFYKRAFHITEQNFPDDLIRYADLEATVGQNLLRLSRSDDSRIYLLRAYKTLKTQFGTEHIKTALSALALGEYYALSNNYRSVPELLLPVIEFFSKNPGYRNHQQRAHALMVRSYENMGKGDLATEHLLAIGRIAPWTADQDIRPIFRVNPKYPSYALENNKEGWVIIDCTIDKTGRIQDAVVDSYEGLIQFNKFVLNAVKKYRYAPRFVNGEPVDTPNFKIKIMFVME